jgi:hypothetical protein
MLVEVQVRVVGGHVLKLFSPNINPTNVTSKCKSKGKETKMCSLWISVKYGMPWQMW